jgi:cytoplasmic iron level regulating protein YaaA (DUF328/UPF0246 family)
VAAARAAVLDALAAVLRAGDAAAAALQLPPGVAAAALAADRAVLTSPTTPALRRYAGVVYDGLGYAGLPAPVRRVAARDTLIFSGLWGVLRGDEAVPDYRVPAKAVLPGLGPVGRYWRRALEQELPGRLGSGLVVDLRSSDYAAMWRPPAALAARVVAVRVLSPLPRGGHGVVSYPSKLAKGRLAAALFTRLAEGRPVHSAEDVLAAWRSVGGRAESDGPTRVVVYTD